MDMYPSVSSVVVKDLIFLNAGTIVDMVSIEAQAYEVQLRQHTRTPENSFITGCMFELTVGCMR